ncbi:iron-dependent repressor [Lewinellaceae bacterium SD302]|nr:iron-dependent repressor [Lewinellaceae bacterium SD302]
MLSLTEENYLKAVLHLTMESPEGTGTNDLANQLEVTPATANNMVKRLREKDFLHYEKYGKITLTDSGRKIAVGVLRKHRLWETFLHDKLDFSWDEVHEVAEQLEHIRSEKLIEKLEVFLDYPEYDPHGDPIPAADGSIPELTTTLLSDLSVGQICRVSAVKDTSPVFLQYLEQLRVGIDTRLVVLETIPFDGSLVLEIAGEKVNVSEKLAENLLVRPTVSPRKSG